MTDYPHQPVRIHAGRNGVYDAIYSEDSAAWFIRYTPYRDQRTTVWRRYCEYSAEHYDSARDAALAYERGPVTYRSNEAAA